MDIAKNQRILGVMRSVINHVVDEFPELADDERSIALSCALEVSRVMERRPFPTENEVTTKIVMTLAKEQNVGCLDMLEEMLATPVVNPDAGISNRWVC